MSVGVQGPHHGGFRSSTDHAFHELFELNRRALADFHRHITNDTLEKSSPFLAGPQSVNFFSTGGESRVASAMRGLVGAPIFPFTLDSSAVSVALRAAVALRRSADPFRSHAAKLHQAESSGTVLLALLATKRFAQIDRRLATLIFGVSVEVAGLLADVNTSASLLHPMSLSLNLRFRDSQLATYLHRTMAADGHLAESGRMTAVFAQLACLRSVILPLAVTAASA